MKAYKVRHQKISFLFKNNDNCVVFLKKYLKPWRIFLIYYWLIRY